MFNVVFSKMTNKEKAGQNSLLYSYYYKAQLLLKVTKIVGFSENTDVLTCKYVPT